MEDQRMTAARFTGLVDAYGGDLARWPADSQAPARSLSGRGAPVRQRRRRAGCAPVWARRAWTVSPSIGGAIAPK